MSLKAIIFDLDDTLIEDAEATERTFQHVCRYVQARYHLDPLKLHQAAYRHAKHLWKESATFSYCHAIGISTTEGLWGRFPGSDPSLQMLSQWVLVYQTEVWYLALAEQRLEDREIAAQLAALFREVRSTNYVVFPDVKATLQELRCVYKLAMLTNGDSEMQRAKISRSKLASYFDTIVVSGEIGIGKPEPETFQNVLQKLDVQPAEAAMVGDSLPRDILGAHHSGLRAIWINRLGRSCDAHYAPMVQARIDKLQTLHEVL